MGLLAEKTRGDSKWAEYVEAQIAQAHDRGEDVDMTDFDNDTQHKRIWTKMTTACTKGVVYLSEEDFIQAMKQKNLERLKEIVASKPRPVNLQGGLLGSLETLNKNLGEPLELDNEPALQILDLIVSNIGYITTSSKSLLHLFAIEQERQSFEGSVNRIIMELVSTAESQSVADMDLKDSLDMSNAPDLFCIPLAKEWYFKNYRRLRYPFRILQLKVRTKMLARVDLTFKISVAYQSETNKLKAGDEYPLLGLESGDETTLLVGGTSYEGGPKQLGTCRCTAVHLGRADISCTRYWWGNSSKDGRRDLRRPG